MGLREAGLDRRDPLDCPGQPPVATRRAEAWLAQPRPRQTAAAVRRRTGRSLGTDARGVASASALTAPSIAGARACDAAIHAVGEATGLWGDHDSPPPYDA